MNYIIKLLTTSFANGSKRSYTESLKRLKFMRALKIFIKRDGEGDNISVTFISVNFNCFKRYCISLKTGTTSAISIPRSFNKHQISQRVPLHDLILCFFFLQVSLRILVLLFLFQCIRIPYDGEREN